MEIALHYQEGNYFCKYWKEYFDRNRINYKIVDAYNSNVLNSLQGVDLFLWHVDNLNFRDQIFAKHLMTAIELSGVTLFPDHNTLWHFDDKVAQKYLFDTYNIPSVATYIFYNKDEALRWIEETEFPKVFKLRKGSGSKGVQLVRTKSQAKKLTKQAFNRGFMTISPWFLFSERLRKFKLGKENYWGIIKGLGRFVIPTEYVKMANRERGYIYFQDFIPNNEFDTRVIVIGHRAFGIKRMNRKNDFRASGSGHIIYDHSQIDIKFVKLAFDTNDKLKMQCASFDFVYGEDGTPLIVEVSYGYNPRGYRVCEGYWNRELVFNACEITPEIWMIEDLIARRDSEKQTNKLIELK